MRPWKMSLAQNIICSWSSYEPPPRAVILEAYESVHKGEQRVVPTQPDVSPRLPAGAVLAEDDRPATDRLASVGLHAEPLGVAVAPVAARTLTLFVRHLSSLAPEAALSDDGSRSGRGPKPRTRRGDRSPPQASTRSIFTAVNDWRCPFVRR